MTGCKGRPLPHETDLTAVRFDHQRAAGGQRKEKENALVTITAAQFGEHSSRYFVMSATVNKKDTVNKK